MLDSKIIKLLILIILIIILISSNTTSKKLESVCYINLDKRTDRRRSIKTQLDYLKIPVHRISAIYKPDYGGLGCSMSHYKALMYAKNKNFSNVLICEDDFVLHDKYKSNAKDIINMAIKTVPDYDVIMLASNTVQKKDHNSRVEKVIEAQTRTAYLVNKKFYNVLLNNFDNCIRLQKTHGPKMYDHGHAGDQYWKRLQPLSNWYVLKHPIGYQKKSYSDIQKKIVDYKV